MTDNVYQINFKRLARWWTPHPLRTASWLKFIGCILLVPAALHTAFLLYRKQKLYQLKITPQKVYLERMLNDKFGGTVKNIYIDDGEDHPPIYLYQEEEAKPVYLYQAAEDKPQWLYTEGEAGELRDDFVVFVPSIIVFDPVEMASVVRQYKLAGIKFKIQTYTL